MVRRFLSIAAFLCILSYFAGMWIQSSIAMATPLDSMVDQTPQAICDGTGDVRAFFRSMNFKEDFRVINSLRDEALGRRYYHIRLTSRVVPILRDQLLSNWTLGHFNRATYENDWSARVKRSRNLPTWWNLADPPKTNQIMLARAGEATWYLVTTDDGDACLMWLH